MRILKWFFNIFWNFSEDIIQWKNCRILIYKSLEILYLRKMHFLRIFANPRILFGMKSIDADQVLTKKLQIDPKLNSDSFHILNHYHISKIEKNIWWYNPPQKKAFFGGGSIGLK